MSSVATTAPEKVTTEERTAILERYVFDQGRLGWRVQSQTGTTAQLLKGKPTNHVLHLILSLVTVGVWLVVWALVTIFAGEKQRVVTVDEYGRIHTS